MPSSKIREFAAAWLPACVLILVAANQVRLTARTGLSPWKGGGFGMFSTIDSPGERFLQAHLLCDSEESIPVEIPAQLSSELRRLTHLPSEEELRRFSARLVARLPRSEQASLCTTLVLTLKRRQWNSSSGSVRVVTLLEHRREIVDAR